MRSRVSGIARIKPLPNRRAAMTSVLDVGSSKITCLIGRQRSGEEGMSERGAPRIDVLGQGTTRSRGVKSGAVVDLDAAERAIRNAVDRAERMAGVTVDSLIVNVSCGRLSSEAFSAAVALDGHAVCDADIQRVLAAGGVQSVRDGRLILHSLPTGYMIDQDRGITDPRGMLGSRLGVDMHIVTADVAPLSNLELAVNRCHLEVETMVASAYASALAVVTRDESELGVACIDLGGGTTSLSFFEDGHFVHADGFALGGSHVTSDVARGLSTSLAAAERLKVLHGSALPSTDDERDILSVPPVGEDEATGADAVPRAALTRIVSARIEEILELARDRLVSAGFYRDVGERVVLTGGGSELVGLLEVARRILGRDVRMGLPLGVAGLEPQEAGPSLAAASGLLLYPQAARIEQFKARRPGWPALDPAQLSGNSGYLARVGQWIREGF